MPIGSIEIGILEKKLSSKLNKNPHICGGKIDFSIFVFFTNSLADYESRQRDGSIINEEVGERRIVILLSFSASFL